MSSANLTVEQPPSFDLKAKPADYFAPNVAYQLRSRNAWRPHTLVTLEEPELSQYLVGLAAVPIILIGILVVWLIAVLIIGCCRGKQQRASLSKRKCVIFVLFLLSLGAAIAWITAVAFSISATAFESSVESELSNLSELMDNITSRIENINASIAYGLTASRSLQDECHSPVPVVQNSVNNLANIMVSLDKEMVPLFRTVYPFIETAAEELSDASNVAHKAFLIRTAVIASLSIVELIFALVVLVLAGVALRSVAESRTYGDSKAVTRARKCCLRPACKCCCRCCTPLVTMLTINITITIVLAALLHALALVIADVCTPNVNVNINRVLGQLQGYEPFASYEGEVTEEMCKTLGEADSPSELLSILCYYQTCDPTNGGIRDVALSIDSFSNQSHNKRNDSHVHTLVLLAEYTETKCDDYVLDISYSLAATVSNSLWALYFLSCEKVNEIYANALYDSTCDAQTNYTVDIFISWMTATLLTMLLILLWMWFEPELVPPEEVKVLDDHDIPHAMPVQVVYSTHGMNNGHYQQQNGVTQNGADTDDSKALIDPIMGEMDPSSSFLGGGTAANGTNNGRDADERALVLV